jgi:hypothetical protein
LSSIQSKTLSESKISENGVLSCNHSSCKETNDECGIINTNNISSNNSVDNLSVTNLLEFVGNHKQLLEEKNKLENAVAVLKKHLEFLSKENTDLKNKLTVVNDFISKYKS